MEKAQAAYEGYARFTRGLTFDGRQMPTWDKLSEDSRDAWRAAMLAGDVYEAKQGIEQTTLLLDRLCDRARKGTPR